MPRLQPPRSEAVGDRTRAIFDAVKSRYGAVLEPIAVTALNPEVLEAYFGFEIAFARARQLPERLRELVNLKTAALLGCPFCLDIGSSESRAAGVTEAMIRDLPAFETSPEFDAAEKAVLAYCVAMTRGRAEIDDALFAQLRAHLSDAQLVELTAVIAWENYRSRFNKALGFTAHGFSQGEACALPESAA
jgi:AhpD family alkylhydroperoxidase